MNRIEEAVPGLAACDVPARDRRNQIRFLWACLVWAVVFVGVTFLAHRELLPEGPIAWLVASLPILAAIGVSVMYARFLQQGDELQRMIQLNALALGFGAGWIAICCYPILEEVGAPPIDAGDYLLVMVVGFVVGNFLGRRRYR